MPVVQVFLLKTQGYVKCLEGHVVVCCSGSQIRRSSLYKLRWVGEEVYIFKVISVMFWQTSLCKGKEKGRGCMRLPNLSSNNEFIEKPVENLMSAFKSLS